MRIACVLITHLPVKTERRRRPELRRNAVIVTETYGSEQWVLDASPEAIGVDAGMPLREALARCKKATLVQADVPHYERVFDKIVDLLMQRSPLVEKGDLGCAYVGLDGLDAMYGGEARLIASLEGTVPSDFDVRIGLSSGKFPAYVAASMGREGETRRMPENVAGFLKNLPVNLLPISWEQKTRLHGFGLHTIGQLALLPVGAVQSQFGQEGKRGWELANGIDQSLLMPHKYDETIVERLTFPSPAATERPVLLAIDHLLSKAFARPQLRGRYVRTVTLEGSVMNKPPWTKTFVFKEPVDSKERAYLPLSRAVQEVALPGPLEDLKVILKGVTGGSGTQSSLLSGVRKREQLREMMSRLKARLRTTPPIFRIRELEPWSRIPERRRVLVQFEP